jgi:hypothetical protein
VTAKHASCLQQPLKSQSIAAQTQLCANKAAHESKLLQAGVDFQPFPQSAGTTVIHLVVTLQNKRYANRHLQTRFNTPALKERKPKIVPDGEIPGCYSL